MSTYKELLQEEALLKIKIAEAKQLEAAPILAECIRLIKEFGFTASQLEIKKSKRRTTHLDESFEKDGEKYGGRGPAPAWIKALKAEHTVDKKLNVDAYKKALEAFKVAK